MPPSTDDGPETLASCSWWPHGCTRSAATVGLQRRICRTVAAPACKHHAVSKSNKGRAESAPPTLTLLMQKCHERSWRRALECASSQLSEAILSRPGAVMDQIDAPAQFGMWKNKNASRPSIPHQPCCIEASAGWLGCPACFLLH